MLPIVIHKQGGVGLSSERNTQLVEQHKECPDNQRDAHGNCKSLRHTRVYSAPGGRSYSGGRKIDS